MKNYVWMLLVLLFLLPLRSIARAAGCTIQTNHLEWASTLEAKGYVVNPDGYVGFTLFTADENPDISPAEIDQYLDDQPLSAKIDKISKIEIDYQWAPMANAPAYQASLKWHKAGRKWREKSSMSEFRKMEEAALAQELPTCAELNQKVAQCLINIDLPQVTGAATFLNPVSINQTDNPGFLEQVTDSEDVREKMMDSLEDLLFAKGYIVQSQKYHEGFDHTHVDVGSVMEFKDSFSILQKQADASGDFISAEQVHIDAAIDFFGGATGYPWSHALINTIHQTSEPWVGQPTRSVDRLIVEKMYDIRLQLAQQIPNCDAGK
jgi:hypothetical protein